MSILAFTNFLHSSLFTNKHQQFFSLDISTKPDFTPTSQQFGFPFLLSPDLSSSNLLLILFMFILNTGQADLSQAISTNFITPFTLCSSLNKKIKSLTYKSQGSHNGQLDLATDQQMAALWDVISIMLHQIYLSDDVLVLNQVTTQLYS